MRKGIKIELLGCAGSGKTTLINALASSYPQFKIQTESVRYIKKKYGISFANGDADVQMAVLCLQEKYANNPDDYLLDRSTTNSYSYLKYYADRGESDIPASVMKFIEDESRRNSQENIDLIIFCRPGDFPIVEDGTRITDADYIRDTDAIMEQTIYQWHLEDKVIEPHGSVVERVEYCKPFIDELVKERETF